MTAATDRLLAVMARLRDPSRGCPWDRAQDFASIAPYTIEEAYEVADAIARGDWGDLKRELGDLLFQVVFHAQMAAEAGHFDFEDVANAIADKMERRHPHVFGEAAVGNAAAESVAWETHKAREREAAAPDGVPVRILAGIPPTLPALTRAVKLQKRAARVGFKWPDYASALAKVVEEMIKLGEAVEEENSGENAKDRIADEIGDLFLALANLSRHLEIDPERALGEANRKFERRFALLEAGLAEGGIRIEDMDLKILIEYWNSAKKSEQLQNSAESNSPKVRA